MSGAASLHLGDSPWTDPRLGAGMAPQRGLDGGAERAASRAGVSNIALTLTHDAQWCVGQVILESA